MVRNNLQGCGYCRQCVRIRLQAVLGRSADPYAECAYKHILDSYATPSQSVPADSSKNESGNAPVGSSCGSNCRWTTNSQSSSGASMFDPVFDDLELDYATDARLKTRRRTLPKRKKV